MTVCTSCTFFFVVPNYPLFLIFHLKCFKHDPFARLLGMALFKLEKMKGLRTGDKNEKKSLRISESKLYKNALCSTEW